MSHTSESAHPSPTLFKSINPSTLEEKVFRNSDEALIWSTAHKDWILKKKEIIQWSFPLDRKLIQECWVRML